MPQYVPDDILLELVEVHLSDASNAQLRDALCNLSLTNRRFRSFAIRVLYHSLSFRIDLRITVTPQEIMTSMIRNYTRAKDLIQSRHLLRNVRMLSLHHWDGKYAYIPGLGDSGGVANADVLRLEADDVKKMIMEVIYDNLTRLVPQMPRLRELRLVECVVTPFLYAAIYACPLNLLHVHTDSPADPTVHIPTDLPQELHITNLRYSSVRRLWEAFYDSLEITDQYVTRIAEHSISSLEELSVNSGLLLTFAPYIPDKTLSLQYLNVKFPVIQPWRIEAAVQQSSAAHSLWSILLASPQLRTLIIMGIFPEILPPQDLNNYVIPKLVDVSASPYVLQFLTTHGRNLQRFHVSQCFRLDGQPITQLVQCSPIHLRQFSMAWVKLTVHELLDSIQSLSVFNNLESLDIIYELLDHTLYNDIQRALNTVTSFLQDLMHLHTCHIRNTTFSPNYYKDSQLSMDPRSLGHPSLKVLGVDFCTKNVWYWDVEAGWEQRGWNPTQVQNWYDRVRFSEI